MLAILYTLQENTFSCKKDYFYRDISYMLKISKAKIILAFFSSDMSHHIFVFGKNNFKYCMDDAYYQTIMVLTPNK